MTSAGLLDLADLSPTENAAKARAAAARYTLRRAATPAEFALGHGVLALHRSHIGPLSLAGLEVGTSRALTDAEVAALRAAAGASTRSPAP